MALTTSRRVYVAGRPPGLGFGTCGAISFHWAFVRSVGYGVLLMPDRLPAGAYWTSSQEGRWEFFLGVPVDDSQAEALCLEAGLVHQKFVRAEVQCRTNPLVQPGL